MKIIVTGGGSGGHVYPAVALIKHIKKVDKEAKILYIGKENSYEARLCKKEAIDFIAIEVQYLYRKKIYKNVGTIIDFVKACRQVKKHILSFSPDVIIGMGGYVSAPVMVMGNRLKIKTIIHEQNSIPGLTNKTISRFVDHVAISLEESRPYFKHSHVVLTGNPRANEVIKVNKVDKASLNLSRDKVLLLVFFGSQGGKYVNQKVAEVIPLIDQMPGVETIFVTGKSHYETVLDQLKTTNLKQTYIKDYLDNMPDYLSVCDLVVCRAGATTISELTALGIPAIYIPSPYVTKNHQEKNAKILHDHHAGILLKEKTLTRESLYETINQLIYDHAKLQKMGNQGKKIATIDGIHQFIELIYH